MTGSVYDSLSDADRVLARSTLFSTKLSIPMPQGALPPRRDADFLISSGGEALKEAVRAEQDVNGINDQDRLGAADSLRAARWNFRRAKELYSQLGDRNGQAMSDFCLAHAALLEGNMELALHLSQEATDLLFGVGQSDRSTPE